MAVTHNSDSGGLTNSTIISSGTTIAGFQTTTAGATLLISGIMIESLTPGTITLHWNPAGTNQLMTQIGTTLSYAGTNANASVALFGLVNPTIVNGGINFAASGLSGATNCYVFGVAFNGSPTSSVANATYGLNTSQTTGTTATVATSASVAATDMAVSIFYDTRLGLTGTFANGVTQADGGTAIGKNENDNNNGACEYYTGAGATLTASAALGGSDIYGAMIVAVGTPPAVGSVPYNPYISAPQLASILAQKRKSFSGWNVNPDHRWRRHRGLLVPNRKLLVVKKAA